jgi:hypothetical protein
MKFDENVVLKSRLLSDLYFFTRYFYNKQTNNTFIRGEHFKTISDVLEKVYTHEITRLIINIPPRFGKTEIAVVNFIAKGLMINPRSKFIHTSYSDSLALENSNKIRDLVKSEAYQQICPIKIKSDTDSKAKWYTEQGGGVYATSSGGAITGFGAGIVGYDGFGGAIIIDDPLKPLDANSRQVRTAVNDRFDNTIISRCNNPNTPIIVIMQRLHKEDLSGVLIERGGWHHINLPAINEDGSYLWDYKAETIEDVKKNSNYVFLTQYQQNPTDKDLSEKFFYSYYNEKHYQYGIEPVKGVYLDISFDFNKEPCTAVIGQYNHYESTFSKFDVILGTPKTLPNKSPLEAVCTLIRQKYIDSGMFTTLQIRVTGDATGQSGGADKKEQHSFYTTIRNELKLSSSQFYLRKSNSTHVFSGELSNKVYRELHKGQFNISHPMIEADILLAYPDKDRTLNEAKKELGLHILDAVRYLDDFWFCCHSGKFTSDMKYIGTYIENIKKSYERKQSLAVVK